MKSTEASYELRAVVAEELGLSHYAAERLYRKLRGFLASRVV